MSSRFELGASGGFTLVHIKVLSMTTAYVKKSKVMEMVSNMFYWLNETMMKLYGKYRTCHGMPNLVYY
jgi:hypothetical protein